MMLLDKSGQFLVAENATFGLSLVVGQFALALLVLDLYELRVALGAALIIKDRNLLRIVEKPHNDVTTVADQLPLGNGSGVQTEDSGFALDAVGHTVGVQAVLARGMGTAVTAGRVFAHVGEGRVVVAVGAEDVALALGASRKVQDFKIVQRAFEFLMEFDVAILRQTVGFITVVAIQSKRNY